jgi:two-component system response regulator AlgR
MDIHYILADQKYVNVYHAHGQDLIDDSLKSLEEEFADEFVRIHRGALVAVANIDTLRKTADGQTEVVLRGSGAHGADGIVVSRRHLATVKRRLKKG